MNSLLKKTLAMILAGVLLSALITALLFRVTGIEAYADIKLAELMPRAYFLADRSAEYMQGFTTRREYEAVINSDSRLWDAELYVYNATGELVGSSLHGDRQRSLQLIEKHLSQALLGESVRALTVTSGAGVLAGVPIVSAFGNVIGAAFLVKPMRELTATLRSLIWALAAAMLLSVVLMIGPSYFASRRLTGPLKTMNASALAMAEGDFTVKAHEKGRDEIAQLGRSLNLLSGALSASIGELTFERNRLRGVLDGLGEGVIAVNARGEVMQFNPAAPRLFGCEGRRPEESALYRELQPEIERVVTGKAGSTTLERAQRERTLRFTLTTLYEGEGVIAGALILVQDVSEAVRLEQTRRDYVANVSHELRTPLSAIRSLSDALADGLVSGEENRLRYYAYIQKESLRLSRLIDDLLELSRLQSGAVALHKQRMDAGELLRDVAARYDAIAAEKGFAIRLELPENPPLCFGNADRTEQVLIALIDNAIRHNAQGSDILFSLEARGGESVVLVQNGGHIAEEDLSHIFERFYKADHAHTGEGTGLGLSIAKEIIDLLHERIWAESGGGSVRLFFTLQHYEPAAARVGQAGEKK